MKKKINEVGKGVMFRPFEGTGDKTEFKIAEEDNRKSNERFFKIFDSNPIGMIISNLETTKFQYVNEIFLTSFGYEKMEVIGKTAIEFNLIESEFNEKVLSLLKQQGYAKDIEVLGRKKNGETFWTIASVQIITIGEENLALTSFLDITERKKAEFEIKQKKRRT